MARGELARKQAARDGVWDLRPARGRRCGGDAPVQARPPEHLPRPLQSTSLTRPRRGFHELRR